MNSNETPCRNLKLRSFGDRYRIASGWQTFWCGVGTKKWQQRKAGAAELKFKSREKPSLGFFFYQLFAVGGFVGGDYFFGQFIGDYVVVGKFHGVAGAGLRHGCEVGGVGKHFG